MRELIDTNNGSILLAVAELVKSQKDYFKTFIPFFANYFKHAKFTIRSTAVSCLAHLARNSVANLVISELGSPFLTLPFFASSFLPL